MKKLLNKVEKFILRGPTKDLYWYLRGFYSMNVCKIKDANLVYVPLSKNANTTIRSIIYKINEGKVGKKTDVYSHHNFPRVSRSKFNNTYNFTFVRNPYGRLISVYQEKVKKGDKRLKEYGVDSSDSFKEFVKKIVRVPNWKLDKHIRPQYYQIKNLKINFIGKVENLENDLNNLLNKNGLGSKKIPIKNKSIKILDRDDLDIETKNLIYRKFKKDFEHFGYKK